MLVDKFFSSSFLFFFLCVFWWHWQQQLECLCLCPALSMEDERTDGRRETGSDSGEAPDWSHRLVVATAGTTTTTTDQMKARYLLPPSTVCVSHRMAGAWHFHGYTYRELRSAWLGAALHGARPE